MFFVNQNLFSNKHFLFLWSSQILSQLTIQVMNFLILIVLFEKTRSTVATSFLWVSYALPAIFIGPFAAVFSDLGDKRKILIFTNLLQTLLIFIYAQITHLSVFIIYGIAVLYSLLNQFYIPAELSSLPELVHVGNLPKANGIFFITQQVALIVGFGTASPLYSFLGFRKSLLICSLFLFIATVSTLFLPKMKVDKKWSRIFEKNFLDFLKKTIEGYKIIKRDKNILAPLLLLLILQISLYVIMVSVPVLAEEIFDIPARLAGLYLVVPAGFGSLLSAFLIPKFLIKMGRKIKIIESSLLAISLISCTLILIIPGLTKTFKLVLSIVTIFASGFSYVGILIPTQTFMQEKTPKDFRGRVFGNYWFLSTFLSIFPVILSGTITEIFGVKSLIFIFTVIMFSLFLYMKINEKSFFQEKNILI